MLSLSQHKKSRKKDPFIKQINVFYEKVLETETMCIGPKELFFIDGMPIKNVNEPTETQT